MFYQSYLIKLLVLFTCTFIHWTKNVFLLTKLIMFVKKRKGKNVQCSLSTLGKEL